jgi:hypothetical protein
MYITTSYILRHILNDPPIERSVSDGDPRSPLISSRWRYLMGDATDHLTPHRRISRLH